MSRPDVRCGLRTDIAEAMDRMEAFAKAATAEIHARRSEPPRRLAIATTAAIHALRARVRRLVRRGDALMRGGYRRLAQLPPVAQGRAASPAKRP